MHATPGAHTAPKLEPVLGHGGYRLMWTRYRFDRAGEKEWEAEPSADRTVYPTLAAALAALPA
jgi:hypothetical protein